MKEKKHNPQPLVLNEGYFIDQHYASFDEMVGCSDNWDHYCTYQLLPDGLIGHHQILQLHSMQIAYVKRSGGMMNDVAPAKGCLTFAVIEESEDKCCFDRIKLKSGDILFFDDNQAFNFMSNDKIKFCVVNIQKAHMGTLKSQITKALNHTIKDTEAVMSKTLRNIWKQMTDTDNKPDTKAFKEAELEITAVLSKLLKEQTPLLPKLTKGEEVALNIRNQVYDHMDGKISIKSLAKQYQMSEKTLQNSFKVLFGFTPSQFLRQLKLNHVHHELKHLDAKEGTVSKIALKWGFMHMGQFSKYYTELFSENPSQTLKFNYSEQKSMDKSCVARQEELE